VLLDSGVRVWGLCSVPKPQSRNPHSPETRNPASYNTNFLRTGRVLARREAEGRVAWCGAHTQRRLAYVSRRLPEREFFIDNLLVRIHFIIVMIRWTGLANQLDEPLHISVQCTHARHFDHSGGSLVSLEQSGLFENSLGLARVYLLTLPRRNVKRFRGRLVFKAHRLGVSLSARLESNKEEEDLLTDPPERHACRSGKVDVRLPGKGNPNSNGARPVHLIITMIQWIRTSRLSINNSLSGTC